MRKIPSITALQGFEAAARLGSFAKAAEDLCLTQSAISRQVHGLEDLLGVQLFQVIRQRIVLTKAGRTYLQEIQPLLIGLDASTLRIITSAAGIRLIQMAILPMFGSRWLIPRLSGFCEANSDVQVNFASRMEPFNFDVEPFDVAIHQGPSDWPEAIMHHLFNSPSIAVCSPAFLRKYSIESDVDLVNAPLLQMSLSESAWANWCNRYALPTRNVLRGTRYDQNLMVIEAAMAGLGAALLPAYFVERELQAGELVMASSHVTDADHSYHIVLPKNRPTPPHVLLFCDWLRHEAAKQQSLYSGLSRQAERDPKRIGKRSAAVRTSQ